jgi:integrase
LARDLYPKAGPATWNRQVITPAQVVINHAAELGYVPHIRVKRFKSPKAIRRAADRAWLDRFREHASPEIATLALFMFQGAARIGEAINLSWDDVNLRERRVTIRKTKNGDPHTINLTAELVAELANLTKDGGKVFKFAARWSVYGSWRRACKKAGIEYIPPHQAGRHAFATEMIARNGIDVGTTAKLGNWKSVKLLLDNYVHAENDAAVIESVFGTPTAHKRGKALK